MLGILIIGVSAGMIYMAGFLLSVAFYDDNLVLSGRGLLIFSLFWFITILPVCIYIKRRSLK